MPLYRGRLGRANVMRLERISKWELHRGIIALGLFLFFNAAYVFPLSSIVYLLRTPQTSCCRIMHSRCCEKSTSHYHPNGSHWASTSDCPHTCGFPATLTAHAQAFVPPSSLLADESLLQESPIASAETQIPPIHQFPLLYQRPPPGRS